jgi:hypothetical protein
MRRLTLLAAVLALAGACSDGTSPGGTGRTQILLTDDPFPYGSIARVDVYIKEIAASTTLDTSGLNGPDWTVLARPERAFNLLDFQGGATALAGEVDLPAGQYRAVRLVINTSLSHVIRLDGSEAPVHWPVPGDLPLYAYVEHALDVTAAGARIVIDFDVGRTFLPDSVGGGFWFIPWIRVVNDAATGRITGTVTGPSIEGDMVPLPDIAVLAYTTGPGIAGAIVGTARTDAQGRYVIGYLAAGRYGVAAQAPRIFALTSGALFVDVTPGGSATADLAMARDTSTGSGPDTSTVTPGGPVASVAIRLGLPSQSPTARVGDSIPLAAELRDAAGATLLGRAVAWTVTDSAVLSLEGVFGPYANLRALKAGAATVTATSEGKSASMTFTVTGTGGGGGNAPVATVVLSPATITANVGDSIGTYANLYDANAHALSNRTVTFATSDSAVVAIQGAFGQSVLLKAKRSGLATITAMSEGKAGTAVVTVR